MTITLLTYLIVCPLVGLAGFVDAVAGGGGLISLPAYMIAGLPVQYAIGTNKLSAVMGATIATGKYAKNGFIPWLPALACVPMALGGSYVGAHLALLVSDYYFKRLMLVIVPVTAVYILRNKTITAKGDALPMWKTICIGAMVAFVIGMYDGFYGPGTGVFLILLLTSLAHMPLREANGLSKIINWATNVSAVAVYLVNGRALMALGLTAGVFNMVGSYLGAQLFEKKGSQSVRPLMLAVLVIFYIKVLLELFA